MSMMCRSKWPFLFMCVSHDTRRTNFPQVDWLSTDPREMGRYNLVSELRYTNT